jgi:hypothetical protein
MLVFAFLLAAQTAPAPSELVDVGPPRTATGTLGGVGGAAAGLGIGMGVPAVVIGGGSGILTWLYGGAAAGTITGWIPALSALGVSGGICGAAVCLPGLGAGAATAGAMYGAQAEGRDPMPALYGAIPGLGLAGIATVLGFVAIGVGAAGSLAAITPVAVIVVIAALAGLAAPPCSACGASVADLVWGNQPKASKEEPLAGTAAASSGSTASMKF